MHRPTEQYLADFHDHLRLHRRGAVIGCTFCADAKRAAEQQLEKRKREREEYQRYGRNGCAHRHANGKGAVCGYPPNSGPHLPAEWGKFSVTYQVFAHKYVPPEILIDELVCPECDTEGNVMSYDGGKSFRCENPDCGVMFEDERFAESD